MSGKVWNYVYNSENQMTEAHYFEGPLKLKSVSFFYDALGRRVKKAVEDFQTGNTYSRKYAYDSNEIIAELDEDNNVLATYTHSGLRTDDVLSAEITSSGVAKGLAQIAGTYMYLKDGLGSVQAITTESGQLVQRYIYSSFGKLLKIVDAIGMETTAIKTAFTYTNREIDEETGLYYYRARYYDAYSGRFMQEDPHPGSKLDPSSLNSKHIYVSNNPSNFNDPAGLFKLRNAIAVIASFAISFAVGFGAGLILGPIAGAITGGSIGYAIGGEVAYFTNRLLGGSREESNKVRDEGKIAGLIGGIAGGILGGLSAGNPGSECGGRSPASDLKKFGIGFARGVSGTTWLAIGLGNIGGTPLNTGEDEEINRMLGDQFNSKFGSGPSTKPGDGLTKPASSNVNGCTFR